MRRLSALRRIDRRARRTNRRRVLLGLGLLAGLVVAAATLPLDAWLVAARGWIGLHGIAGAALFVTAFVLLTIAMVPGSILIACGGYLFGLAGGLPLASFAVALGAGAAALVARTLARNWLAVRFRDDPRFVAIDRAVADRGFLIVALSRLSLLMPFNLLNVIYGLSSIPLRTMMFATWLGMLPATLLYAWLGSIAADVRELWTQDVGSDRLRIALIVFSVLVVLAVTLIIHRTATRVLRRELARPAG